MLIDKSLARGIRRAYLRVLEVELARIRTRLADDSDRNRLLSVRTPKAWRKACERLAQRIGHTLPGAQVRLESGARSVAAFFMVEPEIAENPAFDAMRLRVDCLLRPGGHVRCVLPVRIYGHAIDRVIQRAGVVETPISPADIEAIHAEFADALAFAPVALAALAAQPPGVADEITVLLPAAHGVFLGTASAGELAIKTFVDQDRLVPAELDALRGLHELGQEQLTIRAVQQILPGWLNWAPPADLEDRLVSLWRELGWRLALREKIPGLGDRAWASRPAEPTRPALAMAA